MEAKGKTGRIEFDGQYVTIHRESFLARTSVGKGQKRLHIASVTAVQWKPAGLVNGFIQFTVPGGNERRSKFGSQTNDAARDENSVVFTKKQQPAFEAVRKAVDAAISAQHAPAAPAAPVSAASMADELAKLAALVQSGAITQQEFQQAKAKLLGGQ